MKTAELRRASDKSLVKRDDALAIVKEYLSFAVPRKQQFFIIYAGKGYSKDDAKRLLDELQADE